VGTPHKGSPNVTPKHVTLIGLLYNGINPSNSELNPICHLLALLGGATIVVVSRLRVKIVGICTDQTVLCRIQYFSLIMDIFLFLP